MIDFMKSYATDYDVFKKRFKDAGLGSIMDAKNTWRYLLGSDKYLKKEALSKLKNANVNLRDLSTLRIMVKGNCEYSDTLKKD